MRLLRATYLFLLVGLCTLTLRGQSLCLTFDDGFDPRTQSQAAVWNSAILEALKQAHLHAMLLPAGARVASPEGIALVRAWGEAGHTVGNHSYSHRSLGAAEETMEAFSQDVQKAETLLQATTGWGKWFRFPYLKEGDTVEKRDGFRAWLEDHGYRAAAVTIDASDWYYSARFEAWRQAHPGANSGPYRKAYLDHLWSRANYYDGLAREVLGRSVPHAILLHTNAINAAFLKDVIALFEDRGWKFVSPEQAYQDPVYRMRSNHLPAGESLLWALARDKGVKGMRYPGENDVYEKPLLDRLERKLDGARAPK